MIRGSRLQNVGYTIPFLVSATANPLDSTTYYIGSDLAAWRSAAVDACVIVPRSGIIKAVELAIRSGVAGSAEAVPISINVNGVDVYTFNTVWDNATKNYDIRPISVYVKAGDQIVLKIVAPAWATNPTGSRIYAIAYVE
jgi:hypothetical protein